MRIFIALDIDDIIRERIRLFMDGVRGFAPDVRTAGANLRHTMPVQENQTYFLQVWSQASTSGKYVLTVR